MQDAVRGWKLNVSRLFPRCVSLETALVVLTGMILPGDYRDKQNLHS